MSADANRLAVWLDRFPRVAAVIAAAVGMLVLLGWLFGVDALKSIVPGLTFMKANTALGFILSGVALWSIQTGRQDTRLRLVSRICAGLVLLTGLLTLGEYLSGASFGLDQLLIRETTNLPGDIPGRMAINTAVSFTALGAALLMLSKGGMTAIHALALIPAVLAGSALIGYGFDTEEFLRVRLNYTPMALPTAAVFVLLAFGIVTARSDYPLRRILTSSSAAGSTARRLLPALIGFAVAAGWMNLYGVQAGYINDTLALALFTATIIAGGSAMILWNSGMLFEEAAQRERLESLIQQIIDNTPSLVYALDTDGRFIFANKRFASLFGVDRSQLVGNTREYLGMPRQIIEEHRNNDLETIRTLKTSEFEERNVEADSEHIYISQKFPLLDSSEKCFGVCGVSTDITDRRKAEEELRRHRERLEDLVRDRTSELEAANNDLEELVYSIAHDLGIPLRAINGYSHILRTGSWDTLDDEGKRCLGRVEDSSLKMAKMIEGILAFSHSRSAQMTLSETNMEALAQGAFDELGPTAEGRVLKMEIRPLPRCRGDQAMLRQVWSNLLSNAIKFTRSKMPALIEVGGRTEGPEAVYYVKDNGAGFDMRYADKLFGVFRRLHGMEEFEGPGIGLAIVKRIVTRHGGRVWAEGRTGEGATFYFALPRQEG